MIRIHHGNSIYQYIFRVGYLYTPYRMVQDASSDDPDVFSFIYQKFRFDYRSRCQIYGGITGDTNLIIRQVLRAVDSRTEVHDAFCLFIIFFCFQRIGKEMQIVQPVAIKLDGEILRLFQSEKNGVLHQLVFNTFIQRAYRHFAHAAIVLLHHYLYRASHIKLHHGGILHVVHIYLYVVFKQVFPLTAGDTYAYRVVVIMGHTRI